MLVAVIPAKGESTRLVNKNMLRINGKTLVEHAVQFARSSARIAEIFVSTNSEEIARHSKGIGVKVILRGPELGGETPLIEVYRHAFRTIGDERITHIVGIQPDNPDRHLCLDEALDYVMQKQPGVLFTVDGQGQRNGSLQVLSRTALAANPYPYATTLIDNCTNIHTTLDFYLASRNLSACAEAVEVGGRRIGKSEPAFVVAEAACNHMCDLELAKRLIAAAAKAGADGIKFQTYKAERLVTEEAVAFWGNETIRQTDYYRRLDRFGEKEYRELFAYAREHGIIPFSSPFDEDNARMLNDLGMEVFKIASCEVPNVRFIRLVAEFGKPVMLSTGACTPEEIDRAVETVFSTGNYQLILLACTLSYPTRYEDANFLRIRALMERYPGMIIGLSDHTEPDPHMVGPAAAVTLGARVVEKHYTLDRSMTGSGHFFAVNPEDLQKMVANIRLSEKLLGQGTLGIAEAEKKAWESARRSIVAECPILKGQVITAGMLGTKRPAGGLDAGELDKVIGRRAKDDIAPDQRIFWHMLDD